MHFRTTLNTVIYGAGEVDRASLIFRSSCFTFNSGTSVFDPYIPSGFGIWIGVKNVFSEIFDGVLLL